MTRLPSCLPSFTPIQLVLIVCILGLLLHQTSKSQTPLFHPAAWPSLTPPAISSPTPPLTSSPTPEPGPPEPILTCPIRLPFHNASAPSIPATAPVPFYLHEDPALEIRAQLACLQLLLNLQPDSTQLIPMSSLALGSLNSDFALRALTDAAYIEALRRHPLRRTEQKQAQLTIVAMSPLLSSVLPENHPTCSSLITTTHTQRMDKALRVLQAFLEKPRLHTTAVFCSGCTVDVLGVKLHEALRKLHPVILSPNIQTRENDMKFGPRMTVLKRVNSLGHFVIPPLALKPEWFGSDAKPWSKRLLKMAVDMDWGNNSPMVRKALTNLAVQLSPAGLAPWFNQKQIVLRPEALRGAALAQAQFALVTDGRNFQTFFDCAAFGTVPIFVGDLVALRHAMPFEAEIAWDDIFFGVDGANCVREQQEAVGLLLERQLKTQVQVNWAGVAAKLDQAFREHMRLPDFMPDYRDWAKGQQLAEQGNNGRRDLDGSSDTESVPLSQQDSAAAADEGLLQAPAVESLLRGLAGLRYKQAPTPPPRGGGGGGNTRGGTKAPTGKRAEEELDEQSDGSSQ